MKIDELFKNKKKIWKSLLRKRRQAGERCVVCGECQKTHAERLLQESLWICPDCGHYMPMPAEDRIRQLCDDGSFCEKFAKIATQDPLEFPGYEEKLQKYREQTGMSDAFLAGTGRIGQKKVAIGVLDGRFLMGSMGTAAGEKIARLAEYARRQGLPLIIVSASGGARMQEGLFSLMQMAKTAAAVEQFKQSGGLFLSILTDPTTGGVSASYANLGDIILAEPGARIGFAGPRVIQQTIGQTLPEGFQRAQFLLEHGMIDGIVERKEQKNLLDRLLCIHSAVGKRHGNASKRKAFRVGGKG